MSDDPANDLLVVEDDSVLSRALERALHRTVGGRVHLAATSGEAAARFDDTATRIGVAVIDVGLPDGDGLILAETLRGRDPHLGVVVATGTNDRRTADRAIRLGVQGYLMKPFELTEVVINVANAFRWRELQRSHDDRRASLEHLVLERTRDLDRSRLETVQRLANAAERRDPETGQHLERMSAYSALLAERAGLTPAQVELVRVASPMHDIGKIAIRDEILTCADRFTAAQRAEMNRHTVLGHDILAGSESPLLDVAANIARSHHEWWDGSGHPDGLTGAEIPLEARIVAIADVFDALTSARRYKPAFDFESAAATMTAERGTHFDPDLLDVFLSDLSGVTDIQCRHLDDLAIAG